MLASILLLGNVTFRAGQGGTDDDEMAEVEEEAALGLAVAALGCEVEALRFPLLSRNMRVGAETIVTHYTIKAACQSRDALSKAIFSSVFDLVVGRINAVSTAASDGAPPLATIGILDIFGFESLKNNSFEQLCINFVNEMLQEQFNETVFVAEHRLLTTEGIEVDQGALASSANRLALMTKLLTSLDDQCRLGERGSDAEFCQQVGQQYTVRGVCQAETLGKFSITHYAGKVTYTTDGFVLKNSDSVHSDMQACMRTCVALQVWRSSLSLSLHTPLCLTTPSLPPLRCISAGCRVRAALPARGARGGRTKRHVALVRLRGRWGRLESRPIGHWALRGVRARLCLPTSFRHAGCRAAGEPPPIPLHTQHNTPRPNPNPVFGDEKALRSRVPGRLTSRSVVEGNGCAPPRLVGRPRSPSRETWAGEPVARWARANLGGRGS